MLRKMNAAVQSRGFVVMQQMDFHWDSLFFPSLRLGKEITVGYKSKL